MKNLRVRNKLLLGFGTVVLLMLIVAVMAIIGLRQLNDANDTLAEKTLVNTEYVWQMRRNLISEQRYELMALVEDDQSSLRGYLSNAQEEADKNVAVLEQYKQNYRVETSKVDQIVSNFQAMESYREQLTSLLSQGTAEANAEAFALFEDTFKPLQDTQAQLLTEIGQDQNTLAEAQVQSGTRTYTLLILTVVLVIVALVVSIVLLSWLLKAILTPLAEISNAAQALSKGQFDQDIAYESKDEFGQTCKSIQDSFGNLKTIISDLSLVLSSVSSGDLTVSTSTEFPGEMQEIERSMKQLLERLNESMGAIYEAASQVSMGANQVSDGAQALAQGTTEQARASQLLQTRCAILPANPQRLQKIRLR